MENPPFPTPEREKHENEELFRGTLGFDFIFVKDAEGHKKPICVEINGSDSGIFGFEELPKGTADPTFQEIVRTRAQYNDERQRKVTLMKELIKDLKQGFFDASPEAKKKIYDYLKSINKKIGEQQLVKYAFRNPEALAEIIQSRQQQAAYIPEDARPRAYEWGDSPESSTGYWIFKPPGQRRGEGIMIFSNETFARFLEKNEDPQFLLSLGVLQELLPALPADNATSDTKDSPAALRLLMDFQYLKNGIVKPVFEAAYERVASPDSQSSIVNKATGALSVPVSAEEKELAQGLALTIIQNLGKRLEKEHSGRSQDFVQRLGQIVREHETKASALNALVRTVEGGIRNLKT